MLSFKKYPNPAADYLNIVFDESGGNKLELVFCNNTEKRCIKDPFCGMRHPGTGYEKASLKQGYQLPENKKLP